jgi:putative ATP-dependent endonuclease of the OLD family
MHLSRVRITNFRNFAALDVALSGNVLMVGENRVGKSNFIFALRLVLDSSLPDSARQLKLGDIWDGSELANSPEVRVDIDLVDFDNDAYLLALLTDYRLHDDHTIARLSFVFRKKATVAGAPTSEADYEFKVFGGDDETRSIRSDLRRRVSLDLLSALRDAEAELGSWRASPIRPLLEDAFARVPQAELEAIAADIITATTKLSALDPVRALRDDLRTQIAELAGASQDIKATLSFASTEPKRLLRSVGLYIDDGKRGINEASLGSANLALLTLRLAEFSWRRHQNERNYTLVVIEEPEAHLHPHLQRRVFERLFTTNADEPRGLFLTTHSPNIASVAPLHSIVLLKETGGSTQAFSLAHLELDDTELEDLQRYIDTTRADILFSRAVIFVEGDAELSLVPVFAKTIGYDLDELGITVCSVAGVNFSPYVRLAMALDLPFVVITDWDPVDGRPPLGLKRALDLLDDVRVTKGEGALPARDRAALEADDVRLREAVHPAGIFLNSSTLEVEVARSRELGGALLSILEEEEFGALRRARIAQWKADVNTIDGEQLLSMVADIGKGRLAGRLAKKAIGLEPPTYIAEAIKQLVPHD